LVSQSDKNKNTARMKWRWWEITPVESF
jgi:hypothetical protein